MTFKMPATMQPLSSSGSRTLPCTRHNVGCGYFSCNLQLSHHHRRSERPDDILNPTNSCQRMSGSKARLHKAFRIQCVGIFHQHFSVSISKNDRATPQRIELMHSRYLDGRHREWINKNTTLVQFRQIEIDQLHAAADFAMDIPQCKSFSSRGFIADDARGA